MLAKRYRLPIQHYVKERGRSKSNRVFSVRVFLGATAVNRFGVVIPRAIAKKATTRNQIRRLVFSFLQSKKNHKPVQDFLIIARSPIVSLPSKDILRALTDLFT